MSGICGFTGNQYSDAERTVITKMTDRMKHRGPAGAGFHTDEDITLGMRHLFVAEAVPGDAILYNEDKSLGLVCNGRIYNYVQLKEGLEAKGHRFSSRGDTEVLLHLYEEYGVEMFAHLRGMFAFVIYDFQAKKLFASRDFFGIKPFYYMMPAGEFVFASESKSFLDYPGFQAEVNERALEQYLTFQYSVLSETFFKGVYKLAPAHYLIYQDGEVTIEKYWDAMFQPDASAELDVLVGEIAAVVEASVALHEQGDHSVGSCLSSGVDSSYVAATFQGGKTFSVGFFGDYDESTYARALAEELGIENISRIVSAEEYFESLGKIQYHMDEPLADPAAIALYFVGSLAREHVRSVFSGEGADEFFGGYNIYKEPLDLAAITRLPMPIRRLLGALAKCLPKGVKGRNFFIRGSQTVEERFIGNAKIFTEAERNKILKRHTDAKAYDVTKPYYDEVKHLDDITKMQYIDLHLWAVGDILLKADKTSMANSLEIRCPLLDKEVWRVASTIPTRFRVNKEATKYAFRMAAMRKLKDTVAQKKKLGFPVPIRVWLKDEAYAGKVAAAFQSAVAERYFNTRALIELLDRHKAGKADNSRKIWTVYMFLIWHEMYFGEA